MLYNLNSIQQFAEILQDHHKQLVILDFYTEWCKPCQLLAPKLKHFSETYNVVVVKANAEDEDLEQLVAKYNVRAFPTLLFIKEGKIVDNFAGADETRIMNNISTYA